VLGWWKIHDPRYPMVARIARDVLAVPVSMVTSVAFILVGYRVLMITKTNELYT